MQTLLRHSQRIVDICPMHDGPSKGLQTILASAKFWAGQNVMKDSNDDATGQRANLHTQSALGGT